MNINNYKCPYCNKQLKAIHIFDDYYEYACKCSALDFDEGILIYND